MSVGIRIDANLLSIISAGRLAELIESAKCWKSWMLCDTWLLTILETRPPAIPSLERLNQPEAKDDVPLPLLL